MNKYINSIEDSDYLTKTRQPYNRYSNMYILTECGLANCRSHFGISPRFSIAHKHFTGLFEEVSITTTTKGDSWRRDGS